MSDVEIRRLICAVLEGDDLARRLACNVLLSEFLRLRALESERTCQTGMVLRLIKGGAAPDSHNGD